MIRNQLKGWTAEVRHDYHMVGKLRGANDALGTWILVDADGRLRRLWYGPNVTSDALDFDVVNDRNSERPIGCKNVDASKKFQRELGWVSLVDLYEQEDETPERWETVWNLYASTPKKTPVKHVPDEWLPKEVLARRKAAKERVAKDPSQTYADLGPVPGSPSKPKSKRSPKADDDLPTSL